MTEQFEQQYQTMFEHLLSSPVYGIPQQEKEKLILPILSLLHQHHLESCQQYRNIFAKQQSSNSLTSLPYLAVRLFKLLKLSSIQQQDIFKVLQSSGTTSQTPARVFLDKATSSRQSKVLVKILQQSIGKQRLPMLIIDSPAVLKDKQLFSARGAGIQGLSFFGRDHTYALTEDMQPNWPVIEAFRDKYQNQPVLIFGFTFMVWLYFIRALEDKKLSLSFDEGVLLHSGGWKKLEAQKVDNDEFKHRVGQVLGVKNVFNFYGMAEQVGSIFVECAKGHLHAPIFADVIIRDSYTLKPCRKGEPGIIQVLSVIPTSYPGQSILTEDLGTLLGTDDCPCGQTGNYFSVHGRLPKTEVRGCSDTHKEHV